MNLTKLRADSDWKSWLVNGCQNYEEFLQWADQVSHAFGNLIKILKYSGFRMYDIRMYDNMGKTSVIRHVFVFPAHIRLHVKVSGCKT